MQERAQLRRVTQNNAPMPVSDGGGVSRWIVFGALLIVAIFGVMWTKHRRDARANRDLRKEGMALLNDINQKGNKERKRMEEERQRAEQMMTAMSETPKVKGRPVGLDEAGAKRLIEQCIGFLQHEWIRLPMQDADYSSESYPAFAAAKRLRVIERQGNDPKLWPGPGAGGMNMIARGSEYEIPLGLRRITDISKLTGNIDHAEASFRWSYEGRVAAEMLLSGDTYTGVAVFLNKDGAWRVESGTIWKVGGETVDACREM